jgi:hypothetical protein
MGNRIAEIGLLRSTGLDGYEISTIGLWSKDFEPGVCSSVSL